MLEQQKAERPPLLAAFAFKKWLSGFPASEQQGQTAQPAQGQRRAFRHSLNAKLDGGIVDIPVETAGASGVAVSPFANTYGAIQTVAVAALGYRRRANE